jgi:hypothetical protein
MAFGGRDANEIECARISMARNTNVPFKGRIQKRKTHYLQIITFGCNARPVHTDWPKAVMTSAFENMRDKSVPLRHTRHRRATASPTHSEHHDPATKMSPWKR